MYFALFFLLSFFGSECMENPSVAITNKSKTNQFIVTIRNYIDDHDILEKEGNFHIIKPSAALEIIETKSELNTSTIQQLIPALTDIASAKQIKKNKNRQMRKKQFHPISLKELCIEYIIEQRIVNKIYLSHHLNNILPRELIENIEDQEKIKTETRLVWFVRQDYYEKEKIEFFNHYKTLKKQNSSFEYR